MAGDNYAQFIDNAKNARTAISDRSFMTLSSSPVFSVMGSADDELAPGEQQWIIDQPDVQRMFGGDPQCKSNPGKGRDHGHGFERSKQHSKSRSQASCAAMHSED